MMVCPPASSSHSAPAPVATVQMRGDEISG
jgi:hypothetical protein